MGALHPVQPTLTLDIALSHRRDTRWQRLGVRVPITLASTARFRLPRGAWRAPPPPIPPSRAARHGVLAPFLKPGHAALGSINSPMQCMMKEICAQCLQPHRDPVTGTVSYVFSCFNQDQPLDRVDFGGLDARLRQNSVQEKLTAQWIAEVRRG